MSDLGALSSLMPSDLTLAVMAIIAAFFCCVQLLRFDRLAREFKVYAAEKNVPPVNVVQAILDAGGLDKHQKILRTETIFTAGLMAMTLSLLLAITVIAW